MSHLDLNFGNSEEESAELIKLNNEVLGDTDSFDNWEKLVRVAEGFEGGLNRNSNPQAIAVTRDIYDGFLAKFPLLFGYWKKYADLEFAIAGTEAADLVYERGVACITNSVDLWANYCAFKVETSHDSEYIRDLFERGAGCVGLDFLAHPFWDKYIEFEERIEAPERIFTILQRVIHIPLHQYARYFEKFRHMAQHRPVTLLVPEATLSTMMAEVHKLGLPNTEGLEVERALRARIDSYHLEIFGRTQAETTSRWVYESEIKRPYFHVTEIDEAQLVNWRKYLDFEETQGDHARTTFLYERCLVTCALNDEFWLRFARWMSAQSGKNEEVRHIYQRASCTFVPISRPFVRLQYAYFEESLGNFELARDIHEAILYTLPGHLETIASLASLTRRAHGVEAAVEIFKTQINSVELDLSSKADLIVAWARFVWRVQGSAAAARQVYQQNSSWHLSSSSFWIGWLNFEIEQPSSIEKEEIQYKQIKQVHDEIRLKSQLDADTKQFVSQTYMAYLQERGCKTVAQEYMRLDREANGPVSIQGAASSILAASDPSVTASATSIYANGFPTKPPTTTTHS